MAFVTLYIVWWCCERTHDVVSGTTVHTSPPRLLWCCCTTSRSSFFFFFFTLRAMKCTVHAQRCVMCFWVVSLFNFFASVMLLRRTSARFASFSGSLSVDHFQPGFATVIDFHPLTFSNSHRFLLIVMVLHCFACLYLWVVFVNLKGFALACVQWA